ncbi:MAG TPA: hypothetical protein VLL28_09510 [Hyphomicrobiaceae bacterium]|nr:hypothetical protein [Hyphomicrobiaceae bacterium]
MKKTYAVVVALALAMAFVPLSQSQAAHRHHGKAAGTCGENMYWKNGHCLDARDKAS